MHIITPRDWFVLLLFISGLFWFVLTSSTSAFFGLLVVALGILYFGVLRRELITHHITASALRALPRRFVARFFRPGFGVIGTRGHRLIILGFIVVLVGTAFLLFSKLDTRDFWNDEHQVVNAAAGYLYTGDFYAWDFATNDVRCTDGKDECYYGRAWPHTLLIVQAYKLFGISEWSSRIVSALFGILLVLVTYFFSSFFTEDRRIALAATFAVGIFPSFLLMGRNTRMYALLLPLFLVLAYVFYRGLTERSDLSRLPWPRLRSLLERYAPYQYSFLFAAGILLPVLFEIHVNSLALLPALLIFVSIMAVITREQRYVTAMGIGLLGIPVAIIIGAKTTIFGSVTPFLSFFERYNGIYGTYLSSYPFPEKIGSVLLVLGLVSLFFMSNVRLRTKLTYLYSVVGFTFFFFALIADRYASFTYVSHVATIAIILTTFIYLRIVFRFRSHIIRWLLVLLLIGSATYTLATSWGRLYGYERTGNLSGAYKTIVKNYDSDHDVIIGPMIRRYYLREMEEVPTIVQIPKRKQLSLPTFIDILLQHESGWLTWETGKRYHLQADVLAFVNRHFTKHHGDGVDDMKIEVYSFTKEMIPETIVPSPELIEP